VKVLVNYNKRKKEKKSNILKKNHHEGTKGRLYKGGLFFGSSSIW